MLTGLDFHTCYLGIINPQYFSSKYSSNIQKEINQIKDNNASMIKEEKLKNT